MKLREQREYSPIVMNKYIEEKLQIGETVLREGDFVRILSNCKMLREDLEAQYGSENIISIKEPIDIGNDVVLEHGDVIVIESRSNGGVEINRPVRLPDTDIILQRGDVIKIYNSENEISESDYRAAHEIIKLEKSVALDRSRILQPGDVVVITKDNYEESIQWIGKSKYQIREDMKLVQNRLIGNKQEKEKELIIKESLNRNRDEKKSLSKEEIKEIAKKEARKQHIAQQMKEEISNRKKPGESNTEAFNRRQHKGSILDDTEFYDSPDGKKVKELQKKIEKGFSIEEINERHKNKDSFKINVLKPFSERSK